MSNIKVTRRQHYVYQYYLSSWTINRKVWCKRDNKIYNTSTKNVLLETDMYQIYDLNELEKKILNHFLEDERTTVNELLKLESAILSFIGIMDKVNPGVLLKLMNRIFGVQVSLQGKEVDMDKIAIDLMKHDSLELRREIASLVDNIRIQHGEDLMSINESNGKEYLDKLLNDDLKFFEYENERLFDFFLFISSQYLRTAKIRDGISEAINRIIPLYKKEYDLGLDADGKKIYSQLLNGFIYKLAYGLFTDKKYYIILMKSGGKHFITSDQPVMNIIEVINDKGNIDSMELLMPLSPTRAMILSKRIDNNMMLDLNDDQVEYFNDIIKKNSYKILLSDEKELLISKKLS